VPKLGPGYAIDYFNESHRFGIELVCKRVDPKTGEAHFERLNIK